MIGLCTNVMRNIATVQPDIMLVNMRVSVVALHVCISVIIIKAHIALGFVFPNAQSPILASRSRCNRNHGLSPHENGHGVVLSLSTSNSSIDNVLRPASQLKSLISNAKSLHVIRSINSTNSTSIPGAAIATLRFCDATLSGLAVALTMVPEAIAVSLVARVDPLVGLWTTVLLGLTSAVLGGRAGMCSGAFFLASTMGPQQVHGPAYLSVCAMLAGVFQLLGGFVDMGKFIRLVPHTVMLGCVNGLSLVMAKAQLLYCFSGDMAMTLVNPLEWNVATKSMYGITVLTMMLVKLLPRIPILRRMPPTLGALLVSTWVASATKLPVKTLRDVAGTTTFTGGWTVLPQFQGWPTHHAVRWSWQTLQEVLPVAATMAAVGCIQSLLTLQLLDGMANDGQRASTRKECIGQGAGNLLAGLFGGIGGCALLGQSIVNVQSGGGVSRWSGISMALFLGIGMVKAPSLLGTIPVAALAGVMLLVCQSTFWWSSLRILGKIPLLDILVIALVSVITVQRDLAQAVLVGTMASALVFAWRQSTRLTATSETSAEEKYYRLHGPLFFGSTQQFASLFDCQKDPQRIVLDFANSRVMDHSALVAIHSLADAYGSVNKTVTLRRLSPDCTTLLARMYRSGQLPSYEIVESDPNTDPEYGLAVNYNL
jgi:sulfate permease, SulP family